MNKICFISPYKKRYTTQKEAETQLLLLQNNNLRIYFCEDCCGWHLTKKY